MKHLLTALSLLVAFPALADDAKPFNGTDLKGWKFKNPDKSRWLVGRCSMNQKDHAKLDVTPIAPQADGGPGVRELINPGTGGSDIYTEARYGDCVIAVEVMVPKGSNSGIYVMGEYEVQILDSYGKEKVGPGDIGGLYSAAAPRINAAKKPGDWQKFVIEFRAPRFADGKKTSNATFVKVVLNGEVIHENVEVKAPTPSCLTGKEMPTGPIMFQGDHGPVAFRNLTVKPLEK